MMITTFYHGTRPPPAARRRANSQLMLILMDGRSLCWLQRRRPNTARPRLAKTRRPFSRHGRITFPPSLVSASPSSSGGFPAGRSSQHLLNPPGDGGQKHSSAKEPAQTSCGLPGEAVLALLRYARLHGAGGGRLWTQVGRGGAAGRRWDRDEGLLGRQGGRPTVTIRCDRGRRDRWLRTGRPADRSRRYRHRERDESTAGHRKRLTEDQSSLR